MSADGRIDARWYAPLLRPAMPRINAALRQLDSELDPWELPRTGLGGALAIHVADGFGQRRWRRAGRVAVIALEGYNQRVHVGGPSPRERTRWLERDLDWARRTWEAALEEDRTIVRRVMDRVLEPGGGDAGDHPVPEMVLFMRAAVAAGVVVGDVPDDVHATLDLHATWLGLAWEAERGALSAEAWQGALAAVGVRAPMPERDVAAQAQARAREALAPLPEASTQLLNALLSHAPREDGEARRYPRCWLPTLAPETAPRGRPRAPPVGQLDVFRDRWSAAIETALHDLAHSRSRALSRATEYLVRQGGKRLRPLIVLAAAEACEGTPGRGLPVAAAVEWLHQGSLILDDIIDDASLRRGAPALHVATTEPFAAGVAAFLFARVLRALHGMHPEIRKYVAQGANALATGERLELRYTGDPTLTLTQYYQIIEAKTARVFRCAAAVGALAVDAPRHQVRALAEFGGEIGLAFQIIDDLLDYTGDERVLGKRPGTDLRVRKMTLPLLRLRERLGLLERRRLAAALGDEGALSWVLERLHEHEVPDYCRARAREHVARATRAFDALPEGRGRAVLAELTELLVTRRC